MGARHLPPDRRAGSEVHLKEVNNLDKQPWEQEVFWARRNESGVVVDVRELMPEGVKALVVTISKHDQQRKDDLIKTLVKAKEQAETARLYLIANDRDIEEIVNVGLVLEHIDIALGHLGALVES